MKSDPTFWILARSTGLAAYALLTTSVVAGLVVKSRPFGRALSASAATELHRFLALLALVFVGVHGAALVLDSTIRVTLPALVLPGLVSYRPAWTALGVVAADLGAPIYLSFRLRRRIGARNWRRLHWATYGVFAAATVHGLAAGTDAGRLVVLYVIAVAAVTAATAWRALVPSNQGGATRVQDRTRPVAL